jgi:hypothetical protein
VIYYDKSGKIRAVGAEAMKEGICEIAEDEMGKVPPKAVAAYEPLKLFLVTESPVN